MNATQCLGVILSALLLVSVAPSSAQSDNSNWGFGTKKSQGFLKSEKKVNFYMTSWCPYCKKMENFLNESNIPYEKFDIEKDAQGAKAYKELKVRGVPVLVVDRTVIPGYDPAAAQAAWEEWNKRS